MEIKDPLGRIIVNGVSHFENDATYEIPGSKGLYFISLNRVKTTKHSHNGLQAIGKTGV